MLRDLLEHAAAETACCASDQVFGGYYDTGLSVSYGCVRGRKGGLLPCLIQMFACSSCTTSSAGSAYEPFSLKTDQSVERL